jgi:hypothetical protein
MARWPLDSLGNQQKDVDDVQQKKFGYVSLKELENLRVPLGEIPPLLLCQLAMS